MFGKKKPQSLDQIMAPLTTIKANLHQYQNDVTAKIDAVDAEVKAATENHTTFLDTKKKERENLVSENERINAHLNADVFKAMSLPEKKKTK